jgi:hypothetical protein
MMQADFGFLELAWEFVGSFLIFPASRNQALLNRKGGKVSDKAASRYQTPAIKADPCKPPLKTT